MELVAAAIALMGAPAVVNGQERPPFQFADDGVLRVSEVELKAGVDVELLNNTTTRRTVKLRATGFVLKRAKGSALGGVRIDPDITLPAAGHASAKLLLDRSVRLEPGSVSGRIVAFERDVLVTRRDVAIAVPGGTPAKPAIKSLELRAEWLCCGQVWLRGHQLPLEPAAGTRASKLDLEKDAVLGHLTGPDGDTASVKWNGEIESLDGGTIALHLGADGFDRPGEYKGSIDLIPGDDKAGEVELTTVYTHLVVWPVVFLALGILVALAVQVVTQVYRAVWQLQAELADLGAAFRDAQMHFAGLTQGKPYASYSIRGAVDKEIASIRAELNGLKGPLKFSIIPATHDTVVNEMGMLKEDIDAWDPVVKEMGKRSEDIQALDPVRETLVDNRTGFGGDLVDTDRSLDAIERAALASGPPPGFKHTSSGKPVPQFLRVARSRLQGKVLTLEQYRALREQLRKDADFAESWIAVRDRLSELNELARQLSAPGVQLDQAELEQLEAANRKLTAAQLELWKAESAEQLTSDKTVQELREAQQQLYELTAKLKRTHPDSVVDLRRMVLAEGAYGAVQLLRMPRRQAAANSLPEVDYAKRAAEYRERIRLWDWPLAALSFVGALFTGLTTLYFGQAWGTPADYITALFWGLTTQAVVTGLIAAFGRTSNPLSLPAPPTQLSDRVGS